MNWTPTYLAFVLPLTAENVFRPQANLRNHGVTPASRQEWRWVDLAQRLTWLYGAGEALRRLNGAAEPRLAA